MYVSIISPKLQMAGGVVGWLRLREIDLPKAIQRAHGRDRTQTWDFLILSTVS